MDKSHAKNLPDIARLLDDLYSVGKSWIEPKAMSGETPDVLSVVERPYDCGGWGFSPGQVIVSEYKSSVSDLRADAQKPWRGPQVRALGDWRIYWLHKDGDVRPEHVDEDTGWGVMMFDDFSATLVRAPLMYHSVNTWAQTALLIKLMSRRKPADRRPQSRPAASKDMAAAVDYIRQGPLTTAQVKHLIGYNGSPAKLAQELRQTNKVEQAYPGANWTIR